jgi:hypothetical protein
MAAFFQGGGAGSILTVLHCSTVFKLFLPLKSKIEIFQVLASMVLSVGDRIKYWMLMDPYKQYSLRHENKRQSQ